MDDYLLSFILLAFNFDYFHIPPFGTSPALSTSMSTLAAAKKPAKKLFRVLAGTGYRPKRLCPTLSISHYTSIRA